MKKIFVLLSILLIGTSALASDIGDVKQFFDSFVAAANAYKSTYFDYYSKNAIIKRVVIKKDGSTQTVIVPMSEYKKQSSLCTKFCKLRKYTNSYTNLEVNPEGVDYRINVMRKPSTSSYSLPASFLIGKDSSGNFKIKEESMHTKMQAFLRKGK